MGEEKLLDKTLTSKVSENFIGINYIATEKSIS